MHQPPSCQVISFNTALSALAQSATNTALKREDSRWLISLRCFEDLEQQQFLGAGGSMDHLSDLSSYSPCSFWGWPFLKGSLGFFFGVGDRLERRLQPRIRVWNRYMVLYVCLHLNWPFFWDVSIVDFPMECFSHLSEFVPLKKWLHATQKQPPPKQPFGSSFLFYHVTAYLPRSKKTSCPQNQKKTFQQNWPPSSSHIYLTFGQKQATNLPDFAPRMATDVSYHQLLASLPPWKVALQLFQEMEVDIDFLSVTLVRWGWNYIPVTPPKKTELWKPRKIVSIGIVQGYIVCMVNLYIYILHALFVKMVSIVFFNDFTHWWFGHGWIWRKECHQKSTRRSNNSCEASTIIAPWFHVRCQFYLFSSMVSQWQGRDQSPKLNA